MCNRLIGTENKNKKRIYYLSHGNTSMVSTSKLPTCTRWILAIFLIRAIFAIVFMIALPRLEDTSAICTSELVR